MNKVWILARMFLREHPARLALTSLATTAATCIAISVTSSYDAMLQSIDVWANVALGDYELSIAPISQKEHASVPVAVLGAMRSDPPVAAAEHGSRVADRIDVPDQNSERQVAVAVRASRSQFLKARRNGGQHVPTVAGRVRLAQCGGRQWFSN